MPITLLYAALLTLWMLVLSARVILVRRADRVAFGDRDNRPLKRRVRAHGNLVEYTPLALILLGLMEADGASAWLLHLLALPFLVGRLVHGWAFSFADHSLTGRSIGMVLTLIPLGLMALAALWRVMV